MKGNGIYAVWIALSALPVKWRQPFLKRKRGVRKIIKDGRTVRLFESGHKTGRWGAWTKGMYNLWPDVYGGHK